MNLLMILFEKKNYIQQGLIQIILKYISIFEMKFGKQSHCAYINQNPSKMINSLNQVSTYTSGSVSCVAFYFLRELSEMERIYN